MLKRHLAKLISNKFIRFIVVGIVNTIFGYSVFSILIYLNLHYSLASLLATILGVLFNFKTISSLVFKTHNNSIIFKFIAVYCFTYLITIGGLKIFTIYSVNIYFAGFILLIICTPISFVLNNQFVFQKKG